jgi:drug/metabolite transporter (DMT)-like permease
MKHLVLFCLLCLIWGSSFILMKVAAPVFGPYSVSAYRLLFGGATILPYFLMRRRPSHFSRQHILPLLMICLVGNIVPFTVQPIVIHATGYSGFVGSMVVFVPLFTIAWSILILKVHPTRRELAGTMGGLFGLVVLMWDGFHLDISLHHLVLACLVPLGYSLSNVLIKRFMSSVDPIFLSTIVSLTAGMVVLGGTPLDTADYSVGFQKGLAAMAVLAVLCTGIAGCMFFVLVRERGPLYAGLIAYPIPCVALLWGLADGEKVTWVQAVAVASVLLMVALAQSRPARINPVVPTG